MEGRKLTARRTVILLVALGLMGQAIASRPANSHSLTLYKRTNIPSTISIRNDSGGNIAQYIVRANEYRSAQTRVSIGGHCDSACTLYLSLAPEQVCITKNVSFRFHAPTARTGAATLAATGIMLDSYPSWVREWIAAKGGLRRNLTTMSYNYARRFIQPCANDTVY